SCWMQITLFQVVYNTTQYGPMRFATRSEFGAAARQFLSRVDQGTDRSETFPTVVMQQHKYSSQHHGWRNTAVRFVSLKWERNRSLRTHIAFQERCVSTALLIWKINCAAILLTALPLKHSLPGLVLPKKRR